MNKFLMRKRLKIALKQYADGVPISDIAKAAKCSEIEIATKLVAYKATRPKLEVQRFNSSLFERMINWAHYINVELGEITSEMNEHFFAVDVYNGKNQIAPRSKISVVTAGIEHLLKRMQEQLSNFKSARAADWNRYNHIRRLQGREFIEDFEFNLMKQGADGDVTKILLGELEVFRLQRNVAEYDLLIDQAKALFKEATLLKRKHQKLSARKYRYALNDNKRRERQVA